MVGAAFMPPKDDAESRIIAGYNNAAVVGAAFMPPVCDADSQVDVGCVFAGGINPAPTNGV